MSTYQYTPATDITAGSVDLAILETDIANEPLITTQLTGSYGEPDAQGNPNETIFLEFEADLSAGEKTALDAVVLSHDPTPFIGGSENAEDYSDASVQTENAGVWTEAVNVTTARLAAGRYRLAWTWELKLGAVEANSWLEARISVDGSVVGNDVWNAPVWEGYSSFIYGAIPDGERRTVVVEFRKRGNTGGATTTAEIRRIRIGYELVGSI